jgi:Ca2+-binding EF-hand superfamily protein
MKRTAFLVLAGILLVNGGTAECVAADSNSQRGSGFWGSGGEGGKGVRRPGGLKRLDSDRDGAVTREEFLRPLKERFVRLDTNKDGRLTGEEMSAPLRERAEFRLKRQMKRLDADGDAIVTKAEFEAGPRARFARQDLNSDGKVTEDERPGRRGLLARYWGLGAGRFAGAGRREQAPERTLDKVIAETSALFERLDGNRDGVIEVAELAKAIDEETGLSVKRMMHRSDKDKDGFITEAEFLASGEKRFAVLDLDSDGKITGADLPPGQRALWSRKE